MGTLRKAKSREGLENLRAIRNNAAPDKADFGVSDRKSTE
jgi:hypothetical protein